MCGGGLLDLGELDAVALRPSDHALLLLDGEPIERGEVVHPAHRHHVAAALARLSGWHDRDVRRATNLGVGGPVDEPGDVTSSEICEPGLLSDENRRLANGEGGGARTKPDHVWLGAADPQPSVVLGRRRGATVGTDDGLEWGKVGGRQRWRDCPPDLRTKREH
jgi:hypothetical protein